MRWAALILGVLPLVLVAGCTPSVRDGSAPVTRAGKGAGPSCAQIAPEVRAFTEAMEAASVDAKTRVKTYPGLLAFLVAVDDAASDLDGDLARVSGSGDVATRVKTARSALQRAVELVRSERAGVERHVHDVAPLAKETQQAWGALRAACDRRGSVDCNGVRPVVARYDAAETKAEHEKAVAELVALKLSPATGRLRDRAVVASRNIQSALKGHADEAALLPRKLVGMQKDLGDAMTGLGAVCRAEPLAADLVVAQKPDPRKLTVLVHMKPPVEIEKAMLALAKDADDPEERSFYEGRAEGAFGSGFFLVRKDGGVFVVTNRHVVELGERAELALADGTSLGGGRSSTPTPRTTSRSCGRPRSRR